MRILIASPVHDSKKYCWEEWITNINQIKGNCDVLIVDNSEINGSLKVDNWVYKHIKKKSNESVREVVCRCQNYIKDYAVKNNYDFLFLIEQDNFPKPTDLNYLLNFNKLIIGIPYFKYEPSQKLHYLVWQEVYDKPDGSKEALLTPVNEVFNIFNSKIKQVFNIGFGCLLISKKVLPFFEFRINLKEDCHSDTYFAQDMWMKKIPIYALTDRICKHLDTENYVRTTKSN